MAISSIYSKTITIPETAIDENGHVNNVAYVQWKQDIAVEHYESIGGTKSHAAGGSNLGCSGTQNRVFATRIRGEEIRTWVENIRRVRSLRKYEFSRKSYRRILVKGETDWVFVDAKTGTPRAIPEEASKVFTVSLDI